jgi:uroporphyrinogen-III decarboxylase
MSTELARPEWHLPPLEHSACGAYAGSQTPADAEKRAVWDAYAAGRPKRVPVMLQTNNRVFVLDGTYNRDGLRYEQIFADAEALLLAQLRWQYLLRRRHHLFCDYPTELPETWEVGVHFQNVYEAWHFGCALRFEPDEIPDTRPLLSTDRKRAIFDVDIDKPLEREPFKRGIELTHRMRALAAGKTFCGRPINVLPYAQLGTDGPLTGAINLRGPAILTDLRRDPDYVRQLFALHVQAALNRRRALLAYWGLPEPETIDLADDSCALVSTSLYEQHVLPHHRAWYDALDPQRRKVRAMHLCGDATRHFPTIVRQLGVSSFDTGFPVAFGPLRAALGPQVEIFGGVEVPLLVNGTPAQVYDRARAILQSGVTTGARFVLREGNNLPPRVPWANLAAMYRAGLEFGRYA